MRRAGLGDGAPAGSYGYTNSGYSVYEEENDRLTESLRSKVSAIKSVTTKAAPSLLMWMDKGGKSTVKGSCINIRAGRDRSPITIMSKTDLTWRNEFIDSQISRLSIEIGTEVKNQNKMLSEMENDFDSTGGLLGATMGRLRTLSRGSQTKLLCYMMLFSLFVFFVIYWIIKLR